MSERLSGKRAIVTGGANGIGRETTRQFIAEGARVALLDNDADAVTTSAKAIGAEAYVCDVADPVSIESAVDDAIGWLGGLDILMNAAGVSYLLPFETFTLEQWQSLFEVNLRGPALVTRAALAALRQSASASVINVSSYAGVKPSAFTSAYGATKAGLLMMSKCMAEELAPIRVNAICPGAIETQMTRSMLDDPVTRARIQQGNALQTIGQPADIAAAALFLASDEARFMTGTQMVVDGGSSFC